MSESSTINGLNPSAHLARRLFDEKTASSAATRDGYGQGLLALGEKNKRIMVVCADLTESTRSLAFKKKFPDRFVQLGVSEQAMASIAAGLALAGKIPFISSYACFSPGRNWEQIRTTICLQNTPVIIAGCHAGVSVGPDGATHQMLEDLALMRVLPNMTVLSPCDAIEARKATIAAARLGRPVYLRLARDASPVFTTETSPLHIGKIETFRLGNDVTVIGTGPLVFEALRAADVLAREHGIKTRVLNAHTIKPFDTKTLLRSAKETGAIVTIEEGQTAGGLGGLVCETLAKTFPVPIERIGIPDCFGQSGSPQELLEYYGLTSPRIVETVLGILKRKRR